MISPSLERFRNAAVLTHSAAFSPTNVMHRSMNDAAHLAPEVEGVEDKRPLNAILDLVSTKTRLDQIRGLIRLIQTTKDCKRYILCKLIYLRGRKSLDWLPKSSHSGFMRYFHIITLSRHADKHTLQAGLCTGR